MKDLRERKNYYVEGNIVKKVREKENKNLRLVKVKKTKKRGMSVFSFLSLLVFFSMLSYMAFNFLNAETSMQKNLASIEALERELKLISTNNEILNSKIEASIDLDEIKEVAINKLGMVYANKDQIIRYKKTESEYVRQYEDIPNE